MSERKIVKYEKCSEKTCGFWLTEEDKYCPNCGQIIDKEGTKGCLVAIIVWIGLLISSIVWFGAEFFLLSSVVAFIFFGMRLNTQHKKYKKALGIENILTLRKDEENIKKRLSDLSTELTPVQQKLKTQEESLLRNKQEIIQAGAGSRLKQTIDKLDQAISIIRDHQKLLRSQQQLLEVRLWGIELERWLNTLKPLIINWAGWDKLATEAQYKERLQVFKMAYDEGKQLLQQWHEQRELAVTDEGKKYIHHAEEALNACTQLTDELLARKAHSVIQEIEIQGIPSSYQVKNTPLDQIYEVIAFAELQKEDIIKIETQIAEKIHKLETEQEIQQEIHNF